MLRMMNQLFKSKNAYRSADKHNQSSASTTLQSMLLSKQSSESELITSVVTLLTLVIVMIFFIDYYSDMKLKDNLDQVARKYILALETTSSINSNSLLSDISAATGGWDRWQNNSLDVEISVKGGTPLHIKQNDTGVKSIPNVKYGDEIVLTITGNIKLRTTRWVIGSNIFSPKSDAGSNYTSYKISRASIAKH